MAACCAQAGTSAGAACIKLGCSAPFDYVTVALQHCSSQTTVLVLPAAVLTALAGWSLHHLAPALHTAYGPCGLRSCDAGAALPEAGANRPVQPQDLHHEQCRPSHAACTYSHTQVRRLAGGDSCSWRRLTCVDSHDVALEALETSALFW